MTIEWSAIDWAANFWPLSIACILVFASGLYCILVSRNLIRVLVGMELLTKSVTLFLALAGAVTGRTALVQALIITLIVVEVVVLSVAAGIVIGAWRKTGVVDVKALTTLKG